jgi:hypothetical protein
MSFCSCCDERLQPSCQFHGPSLQTQFVRTVTPGKPSASPTVNRLC